MLNAPLDFRDRRRRGRRWPLVLLVVALIGAAGGGYVLYRKSTDRPSPIPTVREFLTAWSRGDGAGVHEHLLDPPATLNAAYQEFTRVLQPKSLTATVTGTKGDRVSYDVVVLLAGLSEWRYSTSVQVEWRRGKWGIRWTPSAIHPRYVAGAHWKRTRTWGQRASILDATGRPLTGPGAVVVVGVVPGRVKNAKVLARTVAAQTSVSATTVLNLLRRNAGRPTLFVPIVTLREAAYKKAKPVLYPVPGLVFQRKSQQLTPTPTYARQVLGRVGEATAEDLKRLGPGYLRGDQVGQTGLERAYERELAGRPSGTVSLVRDGHEEVVVRLPGVRPEALRSTLDRKTQNAAEAALGGMVQPAALVAVSVRTGRVLAVANRPTTQAFNRGVLGRYPPGSTFKVVTAAALLAAGRTPTSALSCPPTLKVSGRTFRNSEGERLGRVPLSTAFALSCNTAFIGAARVLAQAKLLDMAHRFGFGATGGAGAGGQLPKPKDSVEYVADAIGQGRVTASPLHMATVAATAASGQWRAPAIVIGVPGSKPTQVAAVPRSVIASLRALMRAVVTGGTGVAANVPGAPVHGKTGTAEFGGGSPPKTHAWFIGFRGDVAFAVLVEAGGVGGRVAAPIAARFLRAL